MFRPLILITAIALGSIASADVLQAVGVAKAVIKLSSGNVLVVEQTADPDGISSALSLKTFDKDTHREVAEVSLVQQSQSTYSFDDVSYDKDTDTIYLLYSKLSGQKQGLYLAIVDGKGKTQHIGQVLNNDSTVSAVASGRETPAQFRYRDGIESGLRNRSLLAVRSDGVVVVLTPVYRASKSNKQDSPSHLYFTFFDKAGDVMSGSYVVNVEDVHRFRPTGCEFDRTGKRLLLLSHKPVAEETDLSYVEIKTAAHSVKAVGKLNQFQEPQELREHSSDSALVAVASNPVGVDLQKTNFRGIGKNALVLFSGKPSETASGIYLWIPYARFEDGGAAVVWVEDLYSGRMVLKGRQDSESPMLATVHLRLLPRMNVPGFCKFATLLMSE